MPTSALTQDLIGGWRTLRKSPTHTIVAVMTIALGIALNTTTFSIVQAVLLRPLPYPSPDRLVSLNADFPGLSLTNVGFSVPEMDDLSARTDLFDEVTPVWVFDANLTGGQQPERVVMVASGPNYFHLLGAAPQLGRVFGPQDRADGFAEAVVLSDAAWKRLFGGDPAAIGKQVRIDTDLYTIVGVMPPDFHHPSPAPQPNIDVWSTAGFRANPFSPNPNRRARMLPSALARVKAGVPVEAARAAIATQATATREQYTADYPPDGQWTVRVEPLHDVVVGNVHPLLLAFSAAVALVLLIGCANVANLLLARASTRSREIAIRLAVGAGPGRVIRQLLTENLVLAALGAAAGLVIVWWTQSLLMASMPADLPRISEVRVDWTTLLFAGALTVFTTLACGLAPALQASHVRPVSAMSEIGRGLTAGPRQRRLRAGLVVAEIAASLVLIAGAGLLIATVTRLLDVDPGFDPARVTASRTWIAVPNNPALDQYRTIAPRTALIRNMLEQLRGIAGASNVAMAMSVPLSQPAPKVPITIDGRPLDGDAATAELVTVSPDYFTVLSIPLVRGRVFAETDDAGVAPVAIIDDEAERRFFGGADAVGRKLQLGRPGPQGAPPPITIVGVVKTVKHDRLDEPATPHVYASLYQRSGRSLSMLVKTRADDGAVAEQIRRAVATVDADLPVFATETLDAAIGRSIAAQRFSSRALMVFAACALVLVIGGVYGVMAYTVSTRTHEIGVRIAMGATPATLVQGVMAEALRTAAAGVVLGLMLAMLTTRFVRTMLFGISAADPSVFAIASVLLLAAALTASYFPARRAARVDPIASLRE
jgi:putative ABC transport system permease protein